MRISMWVLAALLTACGSETDTDDTDNTPGGTEFNAAHDVFEAKCAPCHVTGGSGGHNIGAADVDAAYEDSQESATGGTVGDFALARILNGSMPQGAGCSGDPVADAGNADCLTEDEISAIEGWIDAGQPR